MISDEQIRQAAKEYEQTLLASLPEEVEPHEFPAGFRDSLRPRKKPIPWKPILRAACIPLVIGLGVSLILRMGQKKGVAPLEEWVKPDTAWAGLPSNSGSEPPVNDSQPAEQATMPAEASTEPVEEWKPAEPTPTETEPTQPTESTEPKPTQPTTPTESTEPPEPFSPDDPPEPSSPELDPPDVTDPVQPPHMGSELLQELGWVPGGYVWCGYTDMSNDSCERGYSTYQNGEGSRIVFSNSTESYYRPAVPILEGSLPDPTYTVTYSTLSGIRVELRLADGENNPSDIRWQMDGIYYRISGFCTEEELLRMAASVL